MMKDIEGYNGKYQINESGIIINKKGHVMKPAKSDPGYNRVCLERKYDKDGNLLYRVNESIHRLVAETFIPNPENLPVVMHKDNDKLNNHVSNLKWGTYAENTQQAIDDGLMKSGVKGLRTIYNLYSDVESIECIGFEGLGYKTGYKDRSLVPYINTDKELMSGDYKGYKIQSTNKRVKLIEPIRFE